MWYPQKNFVVVSFSDAIIVSKRIRIISCCRLLTVLAVRLMRSRPMRTSYLVSRWFSRPTLRWSFHGRCECDPVEMLELPACWRVPCSNVRTRHTVFASDCCTGRTSLQLDSLCERAAEVIRVLCTASAFF